MTPLPLAADVRRFRGLIADLIGLQFDESKGDSLAKVLHNRVLACGGSCHQYLDWLAVAHQREEMGCLARELTVTETYFLRNMDQFKAYTEVALPDRAAACGGAQNIQVLSAGCASGEEPYSLAIAARQSLPQVADRLSVTALDLNPAMLQKALRARYTNWSLREFPQELRAHCFKSEGDIFVLHEAIRRVVKFESRNLAQDAPDFWRPARFDIVFCRNVLMYFSAEQAQAAVARIAYALVPGGYLFLGHAETLRGLSNDFHLCHTHGTFYYQRKDHTSPPAISAHVGAARWEPASLPGDTSWVEAIQRASERIHSLVPAPAEATAACSIAAAACTAPDVYQARGSRHSERFDQRIAQSGDLPVERGHDPDVLLLKAVSLSHAGALAAAEAVCHELLERDALNAGAHYVLALCREGAGDVAGALEHDQAAIYLDPNFAMPRLHIGVLARRQGQRETAQNDLSRALLLLQHEDAARVLLFGGGFKREALIALCQAELAAFERHA